MRPRTHVWSTTIDPEFRGEQTKVSWGYALIQVKEHRRTGEPRKNHGERSHRKSKILKAKVAQKLSAKDL